MDWDHDLFQELQSDATLLAPPAGTPSAIGRFQAGAQISQPVWRRKDYLTDTWSHVNLARARRPFAAPRLTHVDNPSCLFCPGNEDATPRDIETGGDTMRIGENAWRLRAFPNLYPWLLNHGNIVESPAHKVSLKDIDEEEQFLALQMIQDICRKYEEAGLFPMVFKNHGWGASAAHTHWQYGALPYLPKRVAHERRTAQAFFEKWSLNVFDAIIRSEQAGPRFINEDECVCCIAPFAPRTNYEVCLFLKEKASSLSAASAKAVRSISKALVKLSHALYHGLSVDSICVVCHQVQDDSNYRLHFEMLPFKHWAGAERGFEEYVVEATPEDSADFFRRHLRLRTATHETET
jgi:galactose-1-phosphate uridylyltransferase